MTYLISTLVVVWVLGALMAIKIEAIMLKHPTWPTRTEAKRGWGCNFILSLCVWPGIAIAYCFFTKHEVSDETYRL